MFMGFRVSVDFSGCLWVSGCLSVYMGVMGVDRCLGVLPGVLNFRIEFLIIRNKLP